MAKQIIGHISGYPVGTLYGSRKAVAQAGVHRPEQAGMCGTPYAESVVLNRGYIDDEDYGSYVIYTGEGGRDPSTKRQVENQQLTSRNAALARSGEERLPVRVVRGAAGESDFSPESGFRYDGLYLVADHWSEIGQDGFRIYRYRLEAIPGQSSWTGTSASPDDSETLTEVTVGIKEPPAGNENPGIKSSESGAVERDPSVAQWVKDLYGGQCQACGYSVRTPVGPLSHGCHIQALGKPHNGPDVVGNVLCLCPNCHASFDAGALWITDAFEVCHFEDGTLGGLLVESRHSISVECVRQHRSRFGK